MVSDRAHATPDLNQRVAAAYDRLWNQPPPLATPADQQLANAARKQAQRQGWPPPMAWDDDIIDLPGGEPAPGWKPANRTTNRSVDLDEDIRWVREQGGYRDASMSQLALRLGVKAGTLQQAHLRARQADREAEAS